MSRVGWSERMKRRGATRQRTLFRQTLNQGVEPVKPFSETSAFDELIAVTASRLTPDEVIVRWKSGLRVQDLCESRGGRPGLPSLINLRFLWT